MLKARDMSVYEDTGCPEVRTSAGDSEYESLCTDTGCPEVKLII